MNVKYKFKKINSIAKALDREDLKLDNRYEVTSMTPCKSDTEFHNSACIKRNFKECGISKSKYSFYPLSIERRQDSVRMEQEG